MEPVKGFDATWLYLETDQTPMHVGALQLFDLPPHLHTKGAFFDAVKAQISARLPLVPAYRRRISHTPLHMDHPVWIADKNFDILNHIVGHDVARGQQRGTLSDALSIAVDDHAKPLPQNRPLWAVHVIEGLGTAAQPMAAVYLKFHQAMTDGVADQSYARIMCDLNPSPHLASIDSDDWEGEEEPGFLSSVVRVADNMRAEAARAAFAMPSIARAALRLGRAAMTRTEQFATLSGPQSPFNQPVSDTRTASLLDLPFDRVRTLAQASGVTVTDIVLAASGGAVRTLLAADGTLPDEGMTALVPYSTRASETGPVEDRVSVITAPLGTDIDDAATRLRMIARATEDARLELVGEEGAPFDHYAILGAPAVLRGLVGAYGKLELAGRHRPIMGNMIVSNIVGVSMPLYMAGARMVGNWPLSMLLPGQGVTIAAQSYEDRLFVSVLACAQILADPEQLAIGFDEALADLESLYGLDRNVDEDMDQTITCKAGEVA